MPPIKLQPVSLERMVQAVERVRDRLARAVKVLEGAGIPYAVAGGNAVAAWVTRVDAAAVRNTQDVDILLRREDLERAKEAFAKAGFVYRHVKSIDMFLDGEGAKARDAVHVLFAEERIKSDDLSLTPSLDQVDTQGDFAVVDLEALVRMKLTSFRLKDQVHLQDMVEVELVDDSWPIRFDGELADRLRKILENPEA
ncbi:nucleotidyltransferase family protein [Aeoliella sp. SH292]|uniref:nucleotidyltransferase family protein n=1 Tax=Aeoliella sp. SH292 TaxID=3454464 RepID=UPI003F9CAC1E